MRRLDCIFLGWLGLASLALAQAPLEYESHFSSALSTRSITARALPTNTLAPLPPFVTVPRTLSFHLPASGHFRAQPLNTPPPVYVPSFTPPPVFPLHEQPSIGALTKTGPPQLSLPTTGSFQASPLGTRVSHGASWIMLDASDDPPPLARQSRLLAP